MANQLNSPTGGEKNSDFHGRRLNLDGNNSTGRARYHNSDSHDNSPAGDASVPEGIDPASLDFGDVYDADDSQPVTGPNLARLERAGTNAAGKSSGGGSSSTGNKPFKYRNDDNGDISPAGNSSSTGAGLSGGELEEAEGRMNTAGLGANEIPYTASDQTTRGKIKAIFQGENRRRWAIGGGVAGFLGGGGILGLTILSGPAQMVQLSAVLQRPINSTSYASSQRLGKLLRYADAESIGETRVGNLGRQILKPTLKQLNKAGIEFTTSRRGTDVVKIDPKKLNSELQGFDKMSPEQQKDVLARQFDSISVDQFKYNSSGPDAGKFTVDATQMDSASLKALRDNSLSFLSDGRILTFIKGRVLGPFLGIGNLFHPLRKLQTDKLNQTNSEDAILKEEETRVNDNVAQPVEQKFGTADLRASLRDKLGSSAGKDLQKAVVMQAFLCSFRDSVDDAVKFNQTAIVAPAVAETMDLVAVGEQVKSGQDITPTKVGGVTQSLTDSKGDNIWQGKAMQALEGEPNPSGPGLPTEFAQAFNGTTKADDIKSSMSSMGITALTCSGPAKILGGVIGIIQLVTNLPDGETGSFAEWAAFEGASQVAMGGAIYLLKHETLNLIKDKAVIPAFLSGKLGGNIAAYAARASEKMAAIPDGGIPLANTTASVLGYNNYQQQENQQFRSQSFFARMFDINDYRSLTGKLADAFTPSFSGNVMNFASDLGNFGSLIPRMFSSAFAPVSAADQPYNFGSPMYGIPSNILNDPLFDNPYQNANEVVKLLSSPGGSGYANKAKSCFGVNIDPGTGNITPDHPVDTASSDYTSGHTPCDDISDINWERIMLLVFDTRTMQAVACFNGDQQSCTDVGYPNGGSSAAPGSYQNPLRDVEKNGSLFARRIDQGVDYGGHGSIYAIGDGKVDVVKQFGENSGWPGPSGKSGGWVSYTLTDGPAAGKIVYFAEACDPTVQPGDNVGPGTVICTMQGDTFPWIETGWASDATDEKPLARDYGGNGCCSTTAGVNFNDLLKSLGAPSGLLTNPPIGKPLPSSWPTWK